MLDLRRCGYAVLQQRLVASPLQWFTLDKKLLWQTGKLDFNSCIQPWSIVDEPETVELDVCTRVAGTL